MDMHTNLGTVASGIIRANPNRFFSFLVDIDAGGSNTLKETYGVEDHVISAFAITVLPAN